MPCGVFSANIYRVLTVNQAPYAVYGNPLLQSPVLWFACTPASSRVFKVVLPGKGPTCGVITLSLVIYSLLSLRPSLEVTSFSCQ